jgi:CBS domain containing-hemolysin-like protein
MDNDDSTSADYSSRTQEQPEREPQEESGYPQSRRFGRLRSLFGRKRDLTNGGTSPVLVDLQGVEQVLEEDEHKMIRSIIKLDQTMVREIMVPRVDIVALDVNVPLSEVIKAIIDHGLSRIPLYQDTIDEIVGVVYAKDLLRLWGQSDSPVNLKEVARKAHFVPETKRVDELLHEFREKRVHMAVVVDEYGGVAGLVSLEDLLEEIVGEIEDEFDIGESNIEVISPNEVIADARVNIGQLNEALSLTIEGDDFDTIGGFIFHHLGQIPSPGEEIQANGVKMSVLSTTGRRIRKVKVSKLPNTFEEEQRAAESPNAAP